jgi:hypothetical protein
MRPLGFSVLVLAVGLSAGCQRSVTVAAKSAPAPTAVERGKYLIEAVGCHDCHTPKKMGPNGPELDTTKLLAGHVAPAEPLPSPPPVQKGPWIATAMWDLTAWSGPWGISYAVNLTPDPDTGIGHWTEEMFVQALKTGKHMGKSRPILPPMPWEAFRNFSEDDLKAMFAYTRSVPPIRNRVPEPVFREQ